MIFIRAKVICNFIFSVIPEAQRAIRDPGARKLISILKLYMARLNLLI